MMAPLFLLGAISSFGCVAVDGERIVAADVAKANAVFEALPGETPLAYAPAPGVRRTLGIAEQVRLAHRHGLVVRPKDEICFERHLEPLTPEVLIPAMKASLKSGDAQIEILEFSRFPAPLGEIVFPGSTLGKPPEPVLWRGYVAYAGRRRFRIWARVRISVRTHRVIATEALEPGRPITQAQVRLENYEGFPIGDGAATSLDQVIGRAARRAIRPGSPVQSKLLQKASEVVQGDIVRVIVHSGAAKLQFEGRAESGGRQGDTIRVRNPASGKSFRGKVEDQGLVIVNTFFKGVQ